jgi:hypothetical protein
MSLYQAYEEGRWDVQHRGQMPWLNGDGDGMQNEPEDEREARRRTLTGVITETWPPGVSAAEALPGQTIDERKICAEVEDDVGVAYAWAVVYEPSYTHAVTGTEMVSETLRTVGLAHQQGNRYCARHPGFNEIGIYRIIIYASDWDGLQSRPHILEVVVGEEKGDRYQVYLPLVMRE